MKTDVVTINEMHTPSHVISLTSEYSTSDGKDMPPMCILAYKGQLDIKAAIVRTCLLLQYLI